MTFFSSDPLELPLNYSYNLNVLSEVTVTESFLSLKDNVKNCQERESLDDCITHNYLTSLKEICGCLPLKLGLHKEVQRKDD